MPLPLFKVRQPISRMLRAQKLFTACLASLSFFVPHSPSTPLPDPVRPTRHLPVQAPTRSTFPTLNSPAPWNAGFSRQPLPDRSTFPSLNPLDLLPAKAGVPQVPVPYFPYEDCPASLPQCQT